MTKLGYRPDQAADVLGSADLLDRCVAAGWLKPVVQRHKLTLYTFSDLARVWSRIERGDFPPEPPRKRRAREKQGGAPCMPTI